MSTLSLPRYSVDSFQPPLYSSDPSLCDSSTGFDRARSPLSTIIAATPRPSGGEFVKESRGGNLRLRLYRQSNNDVTVPVFGIRGPVEGTLELSKPKGLVFVAVRVRLSCFYLRASLLGISIWNLKFKKLWNGKKKLKK